jgi:hypothetical protein
MTAMPAIRKCLALLAFFALTHSVAVAQDQCQLRPLTFEVWSKTGQQTSRQGFATAIDRRGVFITADHVLGSVEGTSYYLRSLNQADVTEYPIEDVLRPPTSNLMREDWALFYAPATVLVQKRLDFSYDAFFGDTQPWHDSRVNGRSFRPIQWGIGPELPEDKIGCPEASSLFFRSEDYKHGDSGSSIVSGQCSLVGVTSAFRSAVTDRSVQKELKEHFATLLQWVQKDPPQESNLEPLSDSIASLLRELSDGDTRKAGEALTNTLSVLDDLDIVVGVPASCALGLAAKRLVDENRPLFTHLEPEDRITDMLSGETSKIELVREFLLFDSSVNWLTYLEVMQAFRQMLATRSGRLDGRVVERMSWALGRFAHERQLSHLHEQLRDFLPSRSAVTIRAESNYLPLVVSADFLKKISMAGSLADVKETLLSSDYNLFSTEQGTKPVEYGVELLKSVPTRAPADETAAKLAQDDLAEAISLTLGGLFRARESGVGDKYVAQRARDLALMVQRWRRLFASPVAATKLFSAERWLALFSASSDFRDVTSWGTAFVSFEDARDPVAAWYLRTIEIFSSCSRYDGCSKRLERAQVDGKSVPFTVDAWEDKKCSNTLQIAMQEEDWSRLESALGIPRLKDHYDHLAFVRDDLDFEEVLASVLDEIDSSTDGRFIVPFPCAPLAITPSTSTAGLGDHADQLGTWVKAATLPSVKPVVPLPLQRPSGGSAMGRNANPQSEWTVADDLQQA